jgi:DNA-binding LytR/AlgR family response regulator
MRILIFEDEITASNRLKRMLQEIDPEIEIVGVCDSIEDSVELLNSNLQFDLLITDIHLADGLCFDIFKEVKVEKPLIFLTAYDEYAIRAFKLNSLDYLLKPLKKEELQASLEKYYKGNLSTGAESRIDYRELARAILKEQEQQRQRVVVKIGQQIRAIDQENIAYIYTENKVVYIITNEKQRIPADKKLEEFEEMLDDNRFFRINRQFIVSHSAIKEMYAFSKSRVKLILEPATPLDTIVSKERSPRFKQWIEDPSGSAKD